MSRLAVVYFIEALGANAGGEGQSGDEKDGAHRSIVSLGFARHKTNVSVSLNHVTATVRHASWCSVVQEVA